MSLAPKPPSPALSKSHFARSGETRRSELRKFGFLVGGAFLTVGAIAFWRHRSMFIVSPLGTIGAILVLTGAVAPQVLRRVYAGWMRLARLLSKVTTPVFMGVVYFGVLLSTVLVMRAFGWRGLKRRSGVSLWVARAEGERASALDHQF